MQDGVIKMALYRCLSKWPWRTTCADDSICDSKQRLLQLGRSGAQLPWRDRGSGPACSQCQSFLRCVCTRVCTLYVCTLWCVGVCARVHVCVHLCVCVCAGVCTAPAHVHPVPPQETIMGRQLKRSWSAEPRISQHSVCIYHCLSQCQGAIWPQLLGGSIEFIKMKRSIMLKL